VPGPGRPDEARPPNECSLALRSSTAEVSALLIGLSPFLFDAGALALPALGR
jgi:hypothetical protein